MTFISKTTQNALIECCGDEIQRRIHEAMMFDETTDPLSPKSLISQGITLTVRSLWKENLREHFITLVDANKSAANVNGEK